LTAGNYDELWSIFDRCLTSCPSLELWELYLSYVLKAKASERKAILEAYEFALKHIGKCMGSYPVHLGYIAYVKARTLIST